MNAMKKALLGLYGVIGLLISVFGPFKLPFAESLAKEHYRYAIGGVLIILLILPVAIAVFILSFDANNFKSEIIQYVKNHTQRDLVLQGDIKVTFFPKLGLDSGKMLLSQRNSAREFASVNNARLYIAWLPLLRRKLVFDHVEIEGARANLARFKDGTTNYDDLLIRDETLSPLTFDIDGVRITNSSVNWQDEIKWQRISLQDLQIETGRLADAVPSNLKTSFHLNSDIARSDSRIELRSRLFYDRMAGRYEFADLEGTLKGTAVGFSNLDLNFKGSLDSHPGQELLAVENFLITGTGNLGQRSIEAKLGVPKLQFARGIVAGSQITLDAILSEFDEKWTTTVQVPAFEFANNIFNTAELSADFEFKGEGRALQGKLSSPASVTLETAPKLTLSGITLNFSARHPVLSGEVSGTATGSMQADIAGRNANLDFKAEIDDSKITGTMALLDFNHPAYTFNLNINRLPLDRYISADWIKRYQDNGKFELEGIKDMNLRASLHAGEIKASKLEASNLAADIKIEQSALTIAPLTAKLYGGTLTGSLSLAAQAAPRIMLHENLKGIQVNALLADIAGTDKLAGKGDIAIDISAEGSSIGELRKTLSGTVSIAVARGWLAGIDMRAALLEGKDDLGTKNKARVHEAKFSERTDFSELKAVYNIVDGSSHGNRFDMRSPVFRIAGEGALALDSGGIDYQLAATVAPTLRRRSSGELAELKGVTVPLRVSGFWIMPSIALDFAAATGGIVPKRIAAIAAAAEQTAAPAKRTVPPKKRARKGTRN